LSACFARIRDWAAFQSAYGHAQRVYHFLSYDSTDCEGKLILDNKVDSPLRCNCLIQIKQARVCAEDGGSLIRL